MWNLRNKTNEQTKRKRDKQKTRFFWVLYANNESWNTTSKTNDAMYGDQHNNKNSKKRERNS